VNKHVHKSCREKVEQTAEESLVFLYYYSVLHWIEKHLDGHKRIIDGNCSPSHKKLFGQERIPAVKQKKLKNIFTFAYVLGGP